MDTYCLASTLLFALAGEDHFPGGKAKTPFEIVKAFDEREETPLHEDALPDLTGEPRQLLEDAFKRWLVKDPEERPDMGEAAAGLDVLLEKRRAEERDEENRILHQKTTLRRVQMALIALAVALGIGGLYLLSKRRTLELASELERARRERTDTFDQLDTCQAAHDVSQSREAECRQTRKEDGAHYAATIAALEGKQSELDTKLTSTNHALKTCEDDAETAALVCTEEQEALRSELEEAKKSFEEQKKQLASDLEAAKEELKTAQSAVESAEAKVASCQQDLASCRAEPSDIYSPPPSPVPGPVPGPAPKPPVPPPPPIDPYE
jgi:DNA repair exonuclease SbcCD ATPase subunit